MSVSETGLVDFIGAGSMLLLVFNVMLGIGVTSFPGHPTPGFRSLGQASLWLSLLCLSNILMWCFYHFAAAHAIPKWISSPLLWLVLICIYCSLGPRFLRHAARASL